MKARRNYRQLRVAVVGAGRIGRRHIDLILASADAQLAAIVDPTEPARRLATSANVQWHGELSELLAADLPDAIILATPSAMHAEQGLECIAARVPLMIEKPIATSVADGGRLAEASARQGVPLLIGHHRRHSPLLQAARDLIQGGRIGQVVGVSGCAVFYKPAEYFDGALWRGLPGGGPILINLVHEIDDLRTLCGDIDAVCAIASNSVRNLRVEDTVAIALRFATGALGSFLLSDAGASPWSWEQTSGENAAFASYPDEDCYLISGSRGSLAFPTMRLWTSTGAPSWERNLDASRQEVQRIEPLRLQLEHFLAVVRGEAAPLVNAEDATETLKVTLAIAAAAESGAQVRIARGSS